MLQGWCKWSRHCEGLGLNLALLMHELIRDAVDDYVNFLREERGLKFSSIASYLNGLMGAVQYTALEVSKEPTTLDILNELYAALYNLRGQCEGQAKEDAMYRPRSKEWMSWIECQETRQACIDALDEAVTADSNRASDRRRLLELATETVLLDLLTILPPDRVGVVVRSRPPPVSPVFDPSHSPSSLSHRWLLLWQRKLSVEGEGHTLKKTEQGGYVVDLTAERRSHKTARFYGPRHAVRVLGL